MPDPQGVGTPPGPQRKFTYPELIAAFRQEYPGEFDDYDNGRLGDEILREWPELGSLVDERTKGLEVVEGYEPKFQKEMRAPSIRPGPIPAPVNPRRVASAPEQLIEAGLVVVPSLAGTAIGGAVGAGGGSVVPGAGTVAGGAVGAAWGSLAGGMAGEAMREGFQNWAGTAEGYSLPNIVVQGGINVIPFSKMLGLAKPGAALLTRMAGHAVEGSFGATGSTAAEAMIREHRLPEVPELATSAVLGLGMGTGFGGLLEGVQKVQALRHAPDPKVVTQLFDNLRAGAPADRSVFAQAVVDYAHTVSPHNPTAGAGLLKQLQQEVDLLTQQDLSAFAADYLRNFAERAPMMTTAARADEAKQFLAGLKQRGLEQQMLQTIGETIDEVQRLPEFPVDPATGQQVKLASGELSPGASPAFGLTPEEQELGATLERQFTEAPPLLGPPVEGTASLPPPPSDLSAPPRIAEYPEAGYTATPGQAGLPLLESEFGTARPPRQPVVKGPPVGEFPVEQSAPPPPAIGVDILPAVQSGVVTRGEAWHLRNLSEDLRELGYQPSSRTRGQLALDVTEQARSQEEARAALYEPAVAGTPVQEMFTAMLGTRPGGGPKYSRGMILTQIENLLSGKARRPGAAALAAMKIARIYEEATDPRTGALDWSLVSAETLQDAGLTRQQLRRPMIGMDWEGQPTDLIDKYKPGMREKIAAADAEAAERARLKQEGDDAAADQMYEARQHARGLPAEDLQQLYDDALTYRGTDAEDPYGITILSDEIQRRGLRPLQQPSLETEGPGTPGRLPLLEPEEQPELVKGVREQEVKQPLLANEEDLFTLQSEIAEPSAATLKKRAPSLFDEQGAVGKVGPAKAARSLAQRDLTLSGEHFDELRSYAEANGDQEIAGLLLGDAQGNIRKVIPAENSAADPRTQFEIDERTLRAAQRLAAKSGWELLGSFHSQPTGSAEPSKADLRGAVADMPLVILGVQEGSLRDAKVWQPSGKPRPGVGQAPWFEGALRVGSVTPEQRLAGISPKVAGQMIEAIPKYTGALNDPIAMRAYLKAHKSEFDTEPWFVRASDYMQQGQTRLAALETQVAAVAYAKVGRAAASAPGFPRQVSEALAARVDAAIAQGPQDPVGALFALYDGRTEWVPGVGRIVIAPELPTSLHGQGVTVGPGGIFHPGEATIPIPDEAARETMTVDAINTILESSDAGLVLDDPSRVSATRLFRQVGEQMMLRAPSSKGAMKAWYAAAEARGLSPKQANREFAAQFERSVSESGKMLAALSVWKRRNGEAIRRIGGIRGASGEIEDALIYGAKGRVIGRLGDLAPVDTFKDIIAPTRAWDRVMLLNTLTREEVGTFSSLDAASRAFMLSQWATAARNFWSVNKRWGVELLDEAASAVAAASLRRPAQAINHLKKASDMLRYTPILRKSGWVMPWHARQALFEQVFDAAGYMAKLPEGDRAAMQLLQSFPEEGAHFLGNTAFGEPTPHTTSKYRIVNALANPKLQNTLTMFNRAQEFTARGSMFQVALRDGFRRAGVDPELLGRVPNADLTARVGGEEAMRRLLNHAVGSALDYTFSGDLVKRGYGRRNTGELKGGFNTAIINMMNKVPLVRAGYPWPKFNLSAAPRFIWDHSPGPLLEALNQGIAEATGHAPASLVGLGGRGRFALGRKAAMFERVQIPEADVKILDAQADYGSALQQAQTLKHELSVWDRLQKRQTRRGLTQQALQAADRAEELRGGLERAYSEAEEAENRLKGLRAQRTELQADVDQARAVRAPENYETLLGRALVGTGGLLGAAIMLRADQHDKGTKWYELKYDIPGIGETTLDTRPLAPFTQYLFLGDLITDFYQNTDWMGAATDHESGVDWYDAMLGRYEGKYTAKSFGTELLNAFLSVSQAAGTTLALFDQASKLGERGFDIRDIGRTTVEAVGNYMARFTIPFQQIKAVTDLADTSESNARITSTDQGWAAPLAQPLANLPFIGAAVIPETYNQLTGLPLDAYQPQLRAFLGVTLRQWNRVGGEINATGVPGSSAYIRSSHDVEIDRLVGYNYSRVISEYADQLIFENEYYKTLDSPATRRDYLTGTAFPTMKKIALGQTMMDLGWARMQGARESPEQRRRRLRWDRVNALAAEEGISFKDDDEPEPQEPEPEPDEPQGGAPEPSPIRRLRAPEY